MKNVKYMLSKWYVVLICALITSGLLYVEKSKVNPSVQQTGDIIFTRTVKFNKVPTFTEGQTTTEINLSKIMKMASSQEYMIKMLEDNFRTSKLDKSLDKMSNLNKLIWVDKHFYVEKVGPGVYELVMKYSRNDPKDAEYIIDNSTALIETYEKAFQESAKMLTPDTSFAEIKKYDIIENISTNTESNINKKYAIVGFVLGALIGIVIVMVWNVYHVKA
ncbi:hypothetical protein [Acidaminococcus provencensis]|jgi:hypothetical protein|uniref:hypothetical protein n=1 Tax=Acidaminococcus provencensis TaxID=2058289 RepID=UPI0022DFE5D5|nr:hypothetical protein [Acidaminococcus provencensis]